MLNSVSFVKRLYALLGLLAFICFLSVLTAYHSYSAREAFRNDLRGMIQAAQGESRNIDT